MKAEIDALYCALQFLTRFPLPPRQIGSPANNDEEAIAQEYARALGHSSTYFPLVGVFIGIIGTVVFYLSLQWWPQAIACALTLNAMVLATGGFHEDGLADSADGIGGGWSVKDKLSIMKDSRIGTYGALALLLGLLLKFTALMSIAVPDMLAALVIGHAAGRWTTLPMLRLCDYVSSEVSGEVNSSGGSGKPLVEGFSDKRLWLATASLIAVVLLLAWPIFLTLALVIAVVVFSSRSWLLRKIGGVTGDTLGAVNQLTEISVYLVFAARVSTG